MPSVVDVANRALSAIGTRSQIASLTEQSTEAQQVNLLLEPVRDEVLRLAPWDCATNYINLTLIVAAPGTPENPTGGTPSWQKGIPPPSWAYEYAYPADCLRALWIVPQFTTGFASGVPITTAVTGGVPQFWTGPPVKFKVGIDQILNGVPAVGGADTRVIWTNQEFATLAYVRQITDPGVMDPNFVEAWVAALAGRLAIPLTGDKALANMKIGLANGMIQTARSTDGNEGLTVNNVMPDWIRTRGVAGYDTWEWTPNQVYDWGALLAAY